MSDITVGSVAVSVVPDARGFNEKLKAQLRNLTADLTINADLAQLREQLAEATRTRPVTIDVDADTARAAAQIDEVARDRRATITTDVDRGALSAVSSSLGGISGAGAAIVALGPALVPVVAAVGGLAAILAGPVAAAGAGLTLGGIIAGVAISQTKQQQKAITDLAKKVAAAKLAVDKASTPAGRRSAQLQLAADTKAYTAALGALTPAQKRFLDAQDKLKASFRGLVTSAGGAIFGPLVKGMDLLAKVLPTVKPLLAGVAGGITTLLDGLAKSANGPGLKGLMTAFGAASRGAIVAFGRIFGNVAKGLFNLFAAFGPASKGLVGSIGGMARAFARFDFKNSDAFQGFLAYVRQVGPKVADTFGNIFTAVGKIGAVLAPLGTVSLVLVDGLAKLIATAKPATLAAIAATIGAIGFAILGVSAPTIALVALGVALAGGLAYLVAKVKPLNDAFRGLSGWVTGSLLPAFRDAANKVIPALKDAFHSVAQSVRDNHGLFEVLGGAIKLVGKVLTNVLIPALGTFYSKELPLLGKAIGLAITAIRLLGVAWATMALAGVESLKLLVTAALTTFGGILKAASIGLGWLPHIGKKIRGAQQAFDAFKDGSITALDKTADAIRGVRDTLNNLKPPKPITLKVRLALDSSNKTALALLNLGGKGPSAKTRGMIAGRASGGPVTAGTPYVVGEHRPELFVPETNGRIEPSVSSGGHTGPLVNIEHMAPANYSEFAREIQARQRLAGLSGRRP